MNLYSNMNKRGSFEYSFFESDDIEQSPFNLKLKAIFFQPRPSSFPLYPRYSVLYHRVYRNESFSKNKRTSWSRENYFPFGAGVGWWYWVFLNFIEVHPRGRTISKQDGCEMKNWIRYFLLSYFIYENNFRNVLSFFLFYFFKKNYVSASVFS